MYFRSIIKTQDFMISFCNLLYLSNRTISIFGVMIITVTIKLTAPIIRKSEFYVGNSANDRVLLNPSISHRV